MRSGMSIAAEDARRDRRRRVDRRRTPVARSASDRAAVAGPTAGSPRSAASTAYEVAQRLLEAPRRRRCRARLRGRRRRRSRPVATARCSKSGLAGRSSTLSGVRVSGSSDLGGRVRAGRRARASHDQSDGREHERRPRATGRRPATNSSSSDQQRSPATRATAARMRQQRRSHGAAAAASTAAGRHRGRSASSAPVGRLGGTAFGGAAD